MNSYKIQNKHLVGLASWLNELSLGAKESRERTRFVNLLIESIKETDKFRIDLINKYAKKDEEGNLIKVVNETTGSESYDLDKEAMQSFAKEYNDMMDEFFVLDALDGNKEKLKVVKDIVLNTEYKFGPKDDDAVEEKFAKQRQMNDYSVWCESFENFSIDN